MVSTTFLKVGVCTKCAGGTQGSFPVLLPPTSNDYIFRARTPFGVLLDSMESPLSQDAFHVPEEGSGCLQPCLKYMFCTKCAGYFVVSM